MSDLRYGVIGTGMMGIEHIENINAIDGICVVAVADPHAASLDQAVAAAGGELACFENAAELIDADMCDAVVIATPNFTHIDVLDLVLPTNLHVLIEKPLCTTVADCERVAEAARNRAAITWVGMEYRYMPPVAALIEEVRAGAVGDVQMVSLREHRFPFLRKVGNWNRFRENTGGTLVEKCCHFFDLMNLVAGGRPHRVVASGGQNVNHLDELYDGRRPDILDNAYVIVEFDNGVRGLLDLCMFAEGTKNQEEFVVIGSDAKIESLLPEHVLRIGRRGEHWIGDVDERIVQTDVGHVGLHHGSSYLEHVDFANAIRSGSAPAVTVDDGLLAVAVGAAAHRSIDEGRAVLIDEMLSA